MRLGYYKKQPIIFTEKEYKQICKRFDYTKYKRITTSESMESSASCPLCKKYYNVDLYNSCQKCPIDCFREEESEPGWFEKLGCEVLILNVLKRYYKNIKDVDFFLNQDEVGYLDSHKDKAKKQLKIINNFLNSFVYISSEKLRMLKIGWEII